MQLGLILLLQLRVILEEVPRARFFLDRELGFLDVFIATAGVAHVILEVFDPRLNLKTGRKGDHLLMFGG